MAFASSEAGSDELIKYIDCMLAACCCLCWLPPQKKELNKVGELWKKTKQWCWGNVIWGDNEAKVVAACTCCLLFSFSQMQPHILNIYLIFYGILLYVFHILALINPPAFLCKVLGSRSGGQRQRWKHTGPRDHQHRQPVQSTWGCLQTNWRPDSRGEGKEKQDPDVPLGNHFSTCN